MPIKVKVMVLLIISIYLLVVSVIYNRETLYYGFFDISISSYVSETKLQNLNISPLSVAYATYHKRIARAVLFFIVLYV